MELDGKHGAVEGIGADVAGVLEQGQELRRARVQDAPGLGVDLPADAAQLDHRQARPLRQLADVGLQGAGLADAVAEYIPLGGIFFCAGIPLRGICHGSPLVRVQQQGGVQHHGEVLPGDLPQDLPPLGLPCGHMGEIFQIVPQLRLHLLRNGGNAEGGGVGDLPPVRKGAEKHRVEMPVRENLRVPDLVAAGEDQIVGQFCVAQLLQALKAVAGDAQMIFGEFFKPLVAGLQSLVMQGRVGIRRQAAQTRGSAEQGVILVDIIVYDLALRPQGLHSPLGRRRLQQGTVMVDMIKGDKSCFQEKASFPVWYLISGP